MDEGLSKAVLKVFVELHKAGLIYKDKRLVNWDPKLLTAISDLEVQQIEVKGSLWHLRYPLEGVSFDPENPATFIVVATTRPTRTSNSPSASRSVSAPSMARRGT